MLQEFYFRFRIDYIENAGKNNKNGTVAFAESVPIQLIDDQAPRL